MNRPLLSLFLLTGLLSCASSKGTVPSSYATTESLEPQMSSYESRSSRSTTDLQPGQMLAQGMIGVTKISDMDVSGGDVDKTDHSTDFNQLPMIAGAFQWPMWGDRVDLGLEAGGSLGFQTGSGSVWYAGGGGLAVAVDIDLFIFDLFGGLFASTSLGDKARVYGGVGPLLQFANYDTDGPEGPDRYSESGSGFGAGWYARAGLDLVISRSMMVGLGGRWTESQVSLSGAQGNLDMEGAQLYVAFTSGF
jgi:hypothetical protein